MIKNTAVIPVQGVSMNILLVEDNKTICKGLKYYFHNNNYETVVCSTYKEALEKSGGDYDVIIIDITLPDGNGFELYEEIKNINCAPVIFLTALDDEDNVVKGFELGAEDYITKPFSSRELLARIKRLTKKNNTSNILTLGDITIDSSARTVTKNNIPLELTSLEYRIFLMLVQNCGKTVSRESILERIWDISGNYVNDNTLSVYIKRIRKKLGTDIIKTVKNIGYRMEKK